MLPRRREDRKRQGLRRCLKCVHRAIPNDCGQDVQDAQDVSREPAWSFSQWMWDDDSAIPRRRKAASMAMGSGFGSIVVPCAMASFLQALLCGCGQLRRHTHKQHVLVRKLPNEAFQTASQAWPKASRTRAICCTPRTKSSTRIFSSGACAREPG